MSNPPTEVPSKLSRCQWMLLALSVATLNFTIGCRSARDNQIDLLERELRVQEDYIYELEDYVVEYSEKLRECRSCPQQTAVYAEEIHKAAPAATKSQDSLKPKKTTPNGSASERSIVPKQDELPAPEKSEIPSEIDPSDLDVPDDLDLDLGEPVSETDKPELPELEQDYELAQDGSLLLPDPVEYSSDSIAQETTDEVPNDEEIDDEQFVEELFADDQIEPSAATVERIAKRLEVTQLFHGEDQQQAPQSLLTVVEALDANDEPVDLDGEVSLMVMTTDQESPQRVKRWNFTAEETHSAWQSSDLGDGLHLELPLDKVALPTKPLELWVRLVTADGRKLLTQLPFEASQLRDVASATPGPESRSHSLTKVEPVELDTDSVNPLRIETKTIPASEGLKLARSEQSENRPRWRASMQRTDRTSEGFATTSSSTKGWKTQEPGRLPYVPARMATRPAPKHRSAPTMPVWSSGRHPQAQ